MTDHRVPPQQADPISASTYPHPPPHQLHGQNLHVARDDQQGGIHLAGIPQPMGNVAMQGEMQYPQNFDAPNYNAAHYAAYYPPPPQYLDVPHTHMHRNVGGAEAAPAAQAQPAAPEPEVQVNHDGLYGHRAHFPAADPPEDFPGVWPQPAPPADMPQVDILRDLVGRFLHNPDTHVNVFRIERGPRGRFEVWVMLELANIP